MANQDHDYRLLDILSREESPTQRQVAKQSGLSLGMVNIVLKRLAKTGYIKVSRLSGHTVRYVLTPKGSTELARRSYDYFVHVISSFGELRGGITRLVHELDAEGYRSFVIYGDGDVPDIATLACHNAGIAPDRIVRQVEGAVEGAEDAAVLDCRVGITQEESIGIAVLERVAENAAIGNGTNGRP